MGHQVDLVVNVFERTYRDVLTPGWFPALTASIGYPFTRRVILVNNTDQPADAARRANALIARGDIDEWHFVADHLDTSLKRVGLTRRDIELAPHYSDCALAALALNGSEFLVYWDADVTLDQPCDWVTPSLNSLITRGDVVVANPSWDQAEAVDEATSLSGDFAIGYGFSDTSFLCNRAAILNLRWTGAMVPASYRYPLAHIAPIFEQRADSAMRRARVLRATYLPAHTRHHGKVGTMYPHTGLSSRVRLQAQIRAQRVTQRILPEHPWITPYPKTRS